MTGARTLTIGDCRVYLDPVDVYVRTVFPDGTYAEARPNYSDADRALASALGYASVEEMTLWHDFCHTFLAVEEYEPHSLTLWNVAHGIIDDETANEEESRVLAFQKWLQTGDAGIYSFSNYLRWVARDTWAGRDWTDHL